MSDRMRSVGASLALVFLGALRTCSALYDQIVRLRDMSALCSMTKNCTNIIAPTKIRALVLLAD